ncbi:MAG: GNAT family N-acetyltransferase [Anaerolineales bacterium]|nr:GNAT family N-acetyltransferase [Anaerolineales bacterium]
MTRIQYTNRKPSPALTQELISSVGWEKRSLRDIRLSLENSYQAVFAWDRNLLVGMGRIVSDGVYSAGIWDLVVRPEYQGQAIGSSILRRLIAFLERTGLDTITLFASPGMQGFYRKHGFLSDFEGTTGMLLPVALPGAPPNIEEGIYMPAPDRVAGSSGYVIHTRIDEYAA